MGMLCGLCFRRLVSANFIFGCCYETYIRVFGVTEGKTIQLRTSLYSSSIPCMKGPILLSITDGAAVAAAASPEGAEQVEARRRCRQQVTHSRQAISNRLILDPRMSSHAAASAELRQFPIMMTIGERLWHQNSTLIPLFWRFPLFDSSVIIKSLFCMHTTSDACLVDQLSLSVHSKRCSSVILTR